VNLVAGYRSAEYASLASHAAMEAGNVMRSDGGFAG
jgi:hypothetical protein